MTYAPPEETTLGTVLGRGKRREADATRRVIRAATPLRSSLGIGFIGVGAVVILGLRSIYGLVWLVALWETYPNPLIALTAWVVLLVVVTITVLVARSRVGELPNWMFALFLTGLAVTIALDFTAIWTLNDIGRNATAAATGGMALIIVITTRRSIDIVIASSIIGLVFAVAIVLTTDPDPENYAPQVTTLAFIVLP